MDRTQVRIRNRDIVKILELTLDICSVLADRQRERKAAFVCFKTPQEADYHSTEGRFADKLLECVYSLIPQKRNGQDAVSSSIRVSLEVMDDKKVKLEEAGSETEIASVMYVGLNDEHERRLRKLLQDAENSFLGPDQVASLKEKLQCFLDERQKLLQYTSPFPEYGVMEAYLESYYQALTFLMMNEQLLEDLGSDILQALLQMDCSEDSMSLFSPMAMNQLRKMYLGIELYYRRLLELQDKNTVMVLFYKSVICQKVRQSFRWFFYGKDRKLMHAAVDAYAEEQSGLKLKVGCRGIQQYNSYEGIGELRTGEKILYEMERYLKSGKNGELLGEFRIAILGDIGRRPMENLGSYLNGVLQKRKNGRKLNLRIDAYSKNFSENAAHYENGIVRIEYHDNLDQVFMDKGMMCELLHGHEAVFMMDCVKLYCPVDYSPESSLDYLKQDFVMGNALNNATQDDIDICSPNLLDKLYELMTVRGYHGRLGRFVKKANDTLLKFCEEQVTGESVSGYHTLYVYVSDLAAFDNIYCNDKYYMRTERYNQKEIGIIRYTSDRSEQMVFPVSPEAHLGKMLCFNIWQIVKHISLGYRDGIIKGMLDMIKQPDSGEPIKECDLHSMYVGIDYSDWPKKLSLHYVVVDDESHKISESSPAVGEFLETFVRRIIVPIFNGKREELFQQYFWRAIYSLLYGDAKNVEEMLLIYLLWNKFEVLGNVRMADENNPEQVRNNINWDYKYSIKRFIGMIISKFDISASNSMDQMWTEYIINKSDVVIANEKKLFDDVREACEQIGYTNSYLYRNCKDM